MRKFLAILVIMLVVMMASVAFATVETFDSTATGTYSSLTLPDFTVTYTSGNNLFDVIDSFDPGPPISGNALTSYYQNPNNPAPFKVTLNIGNVTTFKIGVGDYDVDVDDTYLRVFDESGNFLGSDYYQIPVSTNGGDYLSVTTSTPIGYALFWTTGPDYPGSVYWDNLTYGSSSPVPEPTTMLLLGLGLVGLAGVRRKFGK